jgi:hypothetical protein
MSPPRSSARPWPLALGLLLLSGCAELSSQITAIRTDERSIPVEVLAIGASFPTDSSGHLDVRLNLPNRSGFPITATGVTWEAWVEGHHFASGMQVFTVEVAPRDDQMLYLSLPLAFPQLPRREGPVRLQIGLRGKVTARVGDDTEERGFPFSRRMEVLSENAPIFPLPGQLTD